MKKAAPIIGIMILLLCMTVLALPAAVLSYEIYTVQAGDTPENVAARQGLLPSEIISIDDGLWQEGKRVALLKRYSMPVNPQPPVAKSQQPTTIAPKLAKVTQAGCRIFSKPDGAGEFLFQPDVGSQVIVVSETPTSYGTIMANRSTGWIAKSALTVQGPLDIAWLERALANTQTQAISEAFRYLGMPYRYGGDMVSNTDCSKLVQQAFRAEGINLPRTAAQQSQVGMPVSLTEVQPGDRLYFINRKGNIGHTGIFIGNNQFIHASSNRGCVAVDYLAGSYLRNLVAIRR
jgi:cell wall-associated NlpC family hydrolase